MSTSGREDARPRRRRSPAGRIALAVAAVAGGAYFSVLTYCDLAAPEPIGGTFIAVPGGSLVTRLSAGSPLDRSGVAAGDLLISIDGRPVARALDWEGVLARIEIGTPLPLVFQHAGAEQHAILRFGWRQAPLWAEPRGRVLLVSRAVQLVTLGLAFALAARGSGAAALAASGLLGIIAVFSVGLPPRLATLWRELPPPLALLFFIPATSTALIGGAILAFFSILLPWRPPRWLQVLLAAPLVVVAAWRVVFLTALVYQPGWLPRLTVALAPVTLINFAYVAAAVALLLLAYPRVASVADRRRLRWVVAGSVIGCSSAAPILAGLWLGATGNPTAMYAPSLAVQLGYSVFLVMPVSFWWAIARHRLFDLNFVARRSLQWVFARQALSILTPAILGALLAESTLHQGESLWQLLRYHAGLYAGTLIGLLMFRARRAAWLDALDRRLFRERYDACQLLRDVVRQVRTTPDLARASQFAVRQVDAALHPAWLAVYGNGGASPRLPLLASEGTVAMSWAGRSALMDFVRRLERPLEIDLDAGSWLCEHLPGDEVAELRRSGVSLVVPIRVGRPGKDDIVLALGAKQSGEPYSREDKHLLEAVAESLADVRAADSARLVPGDAAADADDDADGEETSVAPAAVAAAAAVDAASWGDFALRRRIGSGGSGSVYCAWDPTLEREVAIKILDPGRPDRAALLAEARHLARVRHQNVVHVYGAAELDGAAGFWMELVEGQTLADRLRDHGTYGADEAAAVGIALCRGLAAIHRAGLVHQDVKAQNVIREGGGRLVLMDLGAGADVRAGAAPRWGTPAYMAPELFDGAAASVRSDLYSVGVLLFHLTTQVYPAQGQTFDDVARAHAAGHSQRLRDLRPDLPEGFLEAIDRALSPRAGQRFATAGELAAALRPAEA